MFEKLKQVGKKLMDKVKEKSDEIIQSQEEIETLRKWQTKFSDSKGNYQRYLDRMNRREWLYLGTNEVDGNVNNPTNPPEGRKLANNVRNVAYELIEAQVDSQIPGPVVKSKVQTLEYLATTVEETIKADLSAVNIERLNDQQERTTPIQGYSFLEVFWDKTKRTHNYIGDVSVRLIHPKQLIPQPGVWALQDMDYFFVMSSVTKQYIKERYGIDVQNESEQYPDINTIGQVSYSRVQSPKVTEIVAWYKDKDGDIGRFVYCNNIILEDFPKLFKRRLDGKEVEVETMVQDYTTQAKLQIPAGTQIPYFTPDKYPIIMRENTPLFYQFGGQSDLDVIEDQQDAIKKIVSKIEEKILKGGSIVALPMSQKGRFKVTDEELKVIWVNPGEMSQINSMTMQPDISKDLMFLANQYDAAKSTLGITNSFQGQPDTTAKSGVAKQVQIAQSSGRMKSKQENKLQAYQELFQIMFQFKLAYADEARPYQTIDSEGNVNYSIFNRYEFIQKDADGQYYYMTDFMFDADPNTSLMSDRITLQTNAINMFTSGALNKWQLWQVLEQLNFPMAAQIKKQVEQTMYLNFYDKPKITIRFQELPQDAQAELLQQIGIQSQGGVAPNLIAAAKNPLEAVQAVGQPQQAQPMTQQQDQQFTQYLDNIQMGTMQPQSPQAVQQMLNPDIQGLLSQLTPQELARIKQHPEILQNILQGGQ